MNGLSELSDSALAARAAADDQEAFACLLGRYSAMITAKATAKSRICGCDIVDDLSQEAAIGFLKAVRSYDAAKGASFRTYAERCVENVLSSAVRSYVSQKNLPLNNHEEFNDAEMTAVVGAYGLSGDPEGYVFYDDGVGRLTQAILSELTELERSVVNLRIDGLSYEQTAAKLGISVKSVDNAIQRVRQKMRSLMND